MYSSRPIIFIVDRSTDNRFLTHFLSLGTRDSVGDYGGSHYQFFQSKQRLQENSNYCPKLHRGHRDWFIGLEMSTMAKYPHKSQRVRGTDKLLDPICVCL